MGILSFRLKKISGSIGEPKEGEIKITSSIPQIKEIKEKEIKIGTSKDKVLSIDFAYKVDYEPIKAKIEIEGEVLYKDEKQKQILKLWKKEKKIDQDIALPLLNYIFRRCSIASIKIADELQLLPPIKLPEFVRK
jgi:hypothetical protein